MSFPCRSIKTSLKCNNKCMVLNMSNRSPDFKQSINMIETNSFICDNIHNCEDVVVSKQFTISNDLFNKKVNMSWIRYFPNFENVIQIQKYIYYNFINCILVKVLLHPRKIILTRKSFFFKTSMKVSI